jgi:hypothetical protein
MYTRNLTQEESTTTAARARDNHRLTAAAAPLGRVGIAALAAVICVGAPVAALASTQSGTLNAGPSSQVANAKAMTGCAANPSSCGFPDASNTGVPKGKKLLTVPGQISSGPGWHYDSRGWVEVDGNGANLTGLYIPYNLDITASNVTISDSKVVTGGANAFGISVRHTSNVTIEDSTIAGLNTGAGRMMTGVKDVYADSTGLTVLRDNISMAETGVQLEAGTVRDSYIHNTGFIAGDHVNGVTSNGGGSGLLTIDHNTILVNRNQTDAVGLFEDFGIQQNRVITNNLLAGGSYALYGGQNPGGAPTANITVTGNVFSTTYYATGGAFGPVTYFNSAGAGDNWSGNTWDGTGQIIASP